MLSIALGVPQHLPPPGTIPGDPVRTFFPHCLGGMENATKFHSDLAFLLVSLEKAIADEIVSGLAMVWVHPYQACIPTLDDAVKKLTLLTTSHENWAYIFVQLNKDANMFPSLRKVTLVL